ncbi:MAG: ATP-binding cassette domain-containing protein [Myxococcales bacterium]|nr:ATP-binding cassette domain-containing protein [Myxococcales bacterium]
MTSALELSDVVKRFGGVAAVDHVSLNVDAGEVLALVGENGAGKSTLISVACGLYRADSGTVRAFGRELPPGDPRAAIDAGIGVVYQHFMLVGPLTVWENVVLGREPRRFGALDAARARREVAGAAGKFGLAVDVDARIETLGVGAQQRVEIVKQLWRGARVLILDEPTAVLAPREAEELGRTVRALAADGRGVIFISHKLREVMAVADRVAVLRRGKLVQTTARTETSVTQVAEAVMGRPLGAEPEAVAGLGLSDPTTGAPVPHPGPIISPGSDIAVEVRDITALSDRDRPALRDLTFSIARGEILGVAGVDGNGQTELAEVLTGLRAAGDLAGGIQQKLIAALELKGIPLPRLVVAVQPTRGLDLGASRRVHDALRDARAKGAAVLVISLDLDELRALSDRILVLYDGRAAGEARPDATDEQLGRLMLGTQAHA